jgi:dihydroorotase-like cyclic amidohydrolase
MVKEIDLIVRGAQLVASGEPTEADLYVHGGKVVGVGRLDLSSKEVVEGKGLFLLPGMIDAHVHFMDPGDLTREGFPQGSAAAAVAGVTTVLEHSHGIRVTNGARRFRGGRRLSRSLHAPPTVWMPWRTVSSLKP